MLQPPSILTVLLFLFGSVLTNAVSAEDNPVAERRSMAFKEYCLECHGAKDVASGGVDLRDFVGDADPSDAELLQRVIDALEQDLMPPEDQPPLGANLRHALVRDLKIVRQNVVNAQEPECSEPIRRMNRFQYNNAVTDLFDLDCIVFTLPERMMRGHNGYFNPGSGKMADTVTVGSRPLGKSQMIEPRLAGVAAFPQDLRAEHGFDNRADHLSLSPLLLESFLTLARSITQSPDFHKQNVGIWKSFFAPPANGANEQREIRRRLQAFLWHAFRGAADEATITRYIQFVFQQRDAGVSFEDAMKSAAAAAISSPRFLYLYGRSRAVEGVADDDFELASRLSFFLWGSIPDQTLLELASKGQLREPLILEQQLRRMLKDRKLKRFCDSFPAQWLQLERIVSSVPNREKFPDFYYLKYRDSMHMMLEPLLVFETVLIENLPVTQLLDSDFTYRSELLEDAYGDLATVPAVEKKRVGAVGVLRFNRVPITDRRTGGVITNAAVMTMTSGPERTQPITRGAWVAGVIFNDPPEPPPADVPALDEKTTDGERDLTLRERLRLHRKRSDCKGCHERIDPFGFALENYDPVGRWREVYENGRSVDVAGRLFRRHEFSNVVQFKDALLKEKDRFTMALSGHLLSFGLARSLRVADRIALERIVEATARDDYRFQTLLREVVFSRPFRGLPITMAISEHREVPVDGHKSLTTRGESR